MIENIVLWTIFAVLVVACLVEIINIFLMGIAISRRRKRHLEQCDRVEREIAESRRQRMH